MSCTSGSDTGAVTGRSLRFNTRDPARVALSPFGVEGNSTVEQWCAVGEAGARPDCPWYEVFRVGKSTCPLATMTTLRDTRPTPAYDETLEQHLSRIEGYMRGCALLEFPRARSPLRDELAAA